MEVFIFRHSSWEQLYNCTGIDVDSVPPAQRRFVPEALVTLLLSFVYSSLYIPCMWSIWKRSRSNACYALLFYVGLMDLGLLALIGFFQAWASLNGIVFCAASPALMYLVGVAVHTLWIAETSSDVCLALNRFLVIVSPDWERRLFHGRRVLLWLGACSLYALQGFLYQVPVIFNGLVFSWLFNPFAGYRDDPEGKFLNRIDAVHLVVIAVASPIFYALFAVCLRLKFTETQISSAEKSTFLQVFLISLLNTITCIMFEALEHVPVSQWMITVAQFSWFHIHGLPPVIYLALNKSIRRDCLNYARKVFPMFSKKPKKNTVAITNGIAFVRSGPVVQATGTVCGAPIRIG